MKPFLALTIFFAVAALAFGYFSFQLFSPQKELLPAAPESAIDPQQPAASSAQQYHPVAADKVDTSLAEAPTGNETEEEQQIGAPEQNSQPEIAEQSLPKPCADSACAERVLAFLEDTSNDEASKVAMAKTWLKPETSEETLSLLHVLKEANETQQHDLADRLLQMLAGADSGESAEFLISVLNGDSPQFSFRELPEDLQYQIKKAIRLNPDERIGSLLADEFNINSQLSDETAAAIQDVKHPDMVYQLARDADWRSETEKVRELVQSLQTFEDPRALEVFARLGKERIVSENETFSSAADWAEAHQDSVAADKYEAVLSDPAAEPTERIVAAAALTGLENADQAIVVLQKASDDEADQNLRYYYEMAIDRISRRAGISTDDSE